jgi:hypothetical protein
VIEIIATAILDCETNDYFIHSLCSRKKRKKLKRNSKMFFVFEIGSEVYGPRGARQRGVRSSRCLLPLRLGPVPRNGTLAFLTRALPMLPEIRKPVGTWLTSRIKILYCLHQNDDWVSGRVLVPQKLRMVRSATFFYNLKVE